MPEIHTIVTHEMPHLDEIAAIWLLRKFGEAVFPGISTAKIIYWNNGGKTPDGRTAEDYEREGMLLIGVGGGRFDEHPTDKNERKEDECAITLVAKALDVNDDPALKSILEFVINNDLKGVGQPFGLASLVKLLHQQYPEDPNKVMDWAMMGIEAEYHKQLEFLTSTKEEFERVAKIEEMVGPKGKVIKVASFTSGNKQMSMFARSAHGCLADVVIQQQLTGNIQIFTNKKAGITLYDVAQMIRIAEMRKKDQIATSDWKKLSAEGSVPGAEEWHFHVEGQMLLNGSLTANGVQATRLTLDEIVDIVRAGINPSAFEPARASECTKGNCASTQKSKCPWYAYGLPRCRQVRLEMKKAKG